MVIIYGIENCDNVKKARRWLDSFCVHYEFHDFRKDGIEYSKVKKWVTLLGWETLINRRSTSWKSLETDARIGMDCDKAIDVILKKPTLIKRPVAESDEILLIGFKPMIYEEHFSNSE